MDDVCFQFPGQTKSVVVKVIIYFHLHEPREKKQIFKRKTVLGHLSIRVMCKTAANIQIFI